MGKYLYKIRCKVRTALMHITNHNITTNDIIVLNNIITSPDKYRHKCVNCKKLGCEYKPKPVFTCSQGIFLQCNNIMYVRHFD